VRADRRRQPLADPDQDRAAAGDPGLISAFIFCFTLCWNEFIYALTFLTSVQNKTVPVAIVNEFVDGDVYRWGSLMAGALAGSLPLVILYAFFVEHYVSAMTGAVKE
jgi:multiple sugar transport system permease protein